MSRYTSNFQDSTCGSGGPDAVWKITPPTAAVSRHFTVDTNGSNFDTVLSVWQGNCAGLVPIACAVSTPGLNGAQLAFRTDGTNTYFIVAEGRNGGIGSLKLRVTSP